MTNDNFVQTTISLSTATGPKYGRTLHKAIVGTVMHMPNPVSKTVNHVLELLPSGKDLNILVDTETRSGLKRQQIVDMGKVVFKFH